MSACDQLTESASLGVAPALRAVDCLANESTSAAFGRLFGTEGALLPALTAVLTLYIAFFAVSLLTGRSRLGISALTPRMMTLGLVLTFSTSWIAYQSVVWNLVIGAPDQIAGILTGAKGSATLIFADRMDIIFAAIAEVAQPGVTGVGATAAASPTPQGAITPSSLVWLSALLLLLGTVGALITARIALAVLLAVGPVFVVFSLFPGTRGLCAGWLRGVVLTAVTPLFVVTGGGLMIELLIPIVSTMRGAEGIDGRASMALFTIAAVHVALMAMVLKVANSIVSAWNIFGNDAAREAGSSSAQMTAQPASYDHALASAYAPSARQTSHSAVVAAAAGAAPALSSAAAETGPAHVRSSRTIVQQVPGQASTSLPSLPAQRARGVGSRFKSRPAMAKEMIR